MRSYGIRYLIILLAFCLVFPSVGANAAAENAVGISMSCDGDAYYGGEIRLRITVSKPSVALSGLEFTLAYDPVYVRPTITENTEEEREMDALVAAKPSGWEQMSYHSEGLYHFRFAMPDSGNSLLDTAGELVLDIPFSVQSAGSFDFVISDADIIAIASDSESTPLAGTGATLGVVADSEAQKLSVELLGNSTVSENGQYYLEIKTTNLGDTSGIIAVEFEVAYDKNVFSPTVTENSSGQMDVFMTDMPGNWEQMCSLDQAKGKYTLRFAAANAESSSNADKLASGEAFTVSIPFKVIGSEGDIASFSVSAQSVIGINSINGIITGSGGTSSVSIEKAPEGTIPGELGYEIRDGYLLYVNENTTVSDFLAPFSPSFSINSKGDTVCTGDILTDGNAITLTVIVLGDPTNSGRIDKYDYILIKRYCMNTVTLDAAKLLAADATRDGKVDRYDYILVKRHCLGTIDISR